jgi:starch synthase
LCKTTVLDDNGVEFEDNDERSMFFCRGVLETVKKLGWQPDVIHCHGWMTSPMGLYLKKVYNKDPHFADTRVVYSLYNEGFNKNWDSKFADKLKFDGIDDDTVANFAQTDLSLSANLESQFLLNPSLYKLYTTRVSAKCGSLL